MHAREIFFSNSRARGARVYLLKVLPGSAGPALYLRALPPAQCPARAFHPPAQLNAVVVGVTGKCLRSALALKPLNGIRLIGLSEATALVLQFGDAAAEEAAEC